MYEKVAWACSPEERLEIRQTKQAPIIDELIQAIKDRLIKGKTQFREALGYFYGRNPDLELI